MNFQYTFRKMANSDFLIKAAQEKLGHACRYLLKTGTGHVWFSRKGHMFRIEVSVVAGGEGHFKASAEDENLYAAIDTVTERLERQFLKKKQIIQKHKNFHISREGKLKILDTQMEPHFELYSRSFRKAA